MQTIDNKIVLSPAWPKEWNVDFKLHAPDNTTVVAILREGEVVFLLNKVTPNERKKNVVSKYPLSRQM